MASLGQRLAIVVAKLLLLVAVANKAYFENEIFFRGYFTLEIQGEGFIEKANHISLKGKLEQQTSLKGKTTKVLGIWQQSKRSKVMKYLYAGGPKR